MMKFFLKIDKLLKAQNLQRKILVTTDTYKEKDAACVLRAFSNIKLSVGTWTDVVRLYLKQCSSMYISLPFQSVLHLVRKRQVTLQHGMAKVSVCRLREVVKEQFYSLMQLATQQASKQLPVAMADDRLGILWRKLKVRFAGQFVTVLKFCSWTCFAFSLLFFFFFLFFFKNYNLITKS